MHIKCSIVLGSETVRSGGIKRCMCALCACDELVIFGTIFCPLFFLAAFILFRLLYLQTQCKNIENNMVFKAHHGFNIHFGMPKIYGFDPNPHT